jgi:hypothetical protein
MSSQDRFIFVPLAVAMLFEMVAACFAMADEPAVRFDVPALVAVHEVELSEGYHAPSPSQKIIEVVISVSSEVSTRDRDTIDEFRFDVFWNRNRSAT